MVKAAAAGSSSQISAEGAEPYCGFPGNWVADWSKKTMPASRSRRFRAESAISEAYMRMAGRLGSLPVSRCVHTAVVGSHSQRSARPLPVAMS